MPNQALLALAKSKKWSGLEQEWLAAIEQPEADAAELLQIIDLVVDGGKGELAATMGWAWLSVMKQTHTSAEALQLGRGLLLRLPDGDELREEILALYRETHEDRPDLEDWIERSGLKSGKSVRRAINYLTAALRLTVGTCLVQRMEDVAAEVTVLDPQKNTVTIRTARRELTLEIGRLVEEYEIAAEPDFRVLTQLHPERLAELIENDPTALVMGILRSRGNRLDRDELRLMLVPHHVPAERWTEWWGKLREGIKRSPHLRTEGRSPMFLVYDAVGQSPEQEAWNAFAKAKTPRDWLDVLEGYLREVRARKTAPDAAFLNRVQAALVKHIQRFRGHKDPATAFATALVIERVATDGLPVSTDAHGLALRMLQEAADAVAVVASVDDARLWPLAVRCVEQVFAERAPELLAELILYAPSAQCDALAKKVEQAGRGNLLATVVDQAVADPGRFTDALMWVWRGPSIETSLPIPPRLEMLNVILGLVGPARGSEGKTADQSISEMRAKVRAGLLAKNCAPFRECLQGLDPEMAQTIRRQVERAEGLGPRVQEEMQDIVREYFPRLYVKTRVEMWEDESVMYFSAAGLQTRETERDEIVNVKMRENAKAIGEAASHGDLSENSEYKFALEERDLLRARLAQLNNELSMARVLEPQGVPMDQVNIGQRLTLRPTAGGEPLVLTIMGANDTDLAGHVYSYLTPVARQLLGRRPGDLVTVSLNDREAEYVIEQIECAVKH